MIMFFVIFTFMLYLHEGSMCMLDEEIAIEFMLKHL